MSKNIWILHLVFHYWANLSVQTKMNGSAHA